MASASKSQLSLWRETLVLAFQKFMRIDGAQRAAAFAYYAFFSLFPLAVLLVTVGSIFFDREFAVSKVLAAAEGYVPLQPEMEANVFETIGGVIEARREVGIVAVIVLVWGSLQFFKALIRAANRAWDTEMHNWWQMPLKSAGLVAMLASAVLIGIAVPLAAKLVETWLPFATRMVNWLSTAAIAFVPFLVLFYGLTLFYRFAPRRSTRFSEVWIAAFGATLLLRLLEMAFGLYLENFDRFNVVYGAFGGIMALLMWIYLSGCVVVFGACLSAAQAQVARGKAK